MEKVNFPTKFILKKKKKKLIPIRFSSHICAYDVKKILLHHTITLFEKNKILILEKKKKNL